MPFRRKRLQPLADAVDHSRSQDIERAGIADRQADDAARVAVDAAMGVEHLHGRSRDGWDAPVRDRATSRATRGLVKGPDFTLRMGTMPRLRSKRSLPLPGNEILMQLLAAAGAII